MEQYIITAAIVLMVGAAFLIAAVARHEAKLVPRTSLMAARRAVGRSRRLVVAGDQCACGGILGPSGRVSEKYGPLLGCTGCSRAWTQAGQRVLRRRVAESQPPLG
jgi:hypothetical protein